VPAGGSGVVEVTPEDAAWIRIEGLERSLDFYPRIRVRGVTALAGELRKRGEVDRGRRLLEEIADDPRVALELARWDLESGLTDDGRIRLDRLLDRTGLPNAIRAQAWTLMAVARDQTGDSDGALEAANKALAHDPRSAGPYRVLAGLAERRGEMDLALEHLRRAWGMNPTDVNLLQLVAITAERAGAHDDARLALERAVAVEPDNPAIRARLVEYQIRRGDLMDATLSLAAALDRFPTDARLLRLAERLRAEVARR
jgi:tetratricopeptide (TPR) repeat protein